MQALWHSIKERAPEAEREGVARGPWRFAGVAGGFEAPCGEFGNFFLQISEDIFLKAICRLLGANLRYCHSSQPYRATHLNTLLQISTSYANNWYTLPETRSGRAVHKLWDGKKIDNQQCLSQAGFWLGLAPEPGTDGFMVWPAMQYFGKCKWIFSLNANESCLSSACGRAAHYSL